MTWHGLRDAERAAGRRRRAGARTAAWPISSHPRAAACADYIGLFAVTAGIGVGEEGAAVPRRPRRLQRDHAEGAGRPAGRSLRRAPAPAGAHRPLGLCRRTRRSTSPTSSPSGTAASARRPGYPACPDHTRQARDVPRPRLRGDRHGTDREPGDAAGGERQRASIFAHPQATYFNVGPIGADQTADWARRSGRTVDEARRALPQAI